jgi:hypothetical protein
MNRGQSQQDEETVKEDSSDTSGESQSGSWASDIEVDDDF